MSDKEAVRLAHHLVLHHFGEVLASVAHPLLHRGRLPLPAICQLSGTPPKLARAALVTLLQHDLIWWTGPDAGNVEGFEANIRAILDLSRAGRVIEMGRDFGGENAADILRLILSEGKLRLPDILSHLAFGQSKKIRSITSTTVDLLKSSFILPYHPSSSVSPRDTRIAYLREEKAKISGYPSPKELRAAWDKVDLKIRQEREQWLNPQNGLVAAKRKREDEGAVKKKKSKDSKGKEKEEEVIDEEVYFKVNFEKFEVGMRNQLVVRAAEDRFNKEAAAVLDAMLKATQEAQISLLASRSEPVSIHQISQNLPSDIKLYRGIVDPAAEASSSTRPVLADTISEFCNILSCQDNTTEAGRKGIFISRNSSGRDSGGSFYVDFQTISSRMKLRVLDAVVRERFGDGAARVINVVIAHEKIDEKQISKVTMLAPKDIRVITAELSAASLLELQEVPRGADRAITRTFYLWHVDLSRAYTALISHLYKTMANLIQRKDYELSQRRALLEKRSRTDVRENGALLTDEEKKGLKELDDMIMKLTLAELRTDFNVMVLRDLPGGPLSTANSRFGAD